MRSSKLHVDETKQDRQRPAALAKGGRDKMLPKQAANQQKPGTTSHEVKGTAPGSKAAQGGGRTPPSVGGKARPARGGTTGPG